MTRGVKTSLAVTLSIALVGCATIIHKGGKQWVLITSTPSGATATIDGVTRVTVKCCG